LRGVNISCRDVTPWIAVNIDGTRKPPVVIVVIVVRSILGRGPRIAIGSKDVVVVWLWRTLEGGRSRR